MLVILGCQNAKPGEFTERAFLNGKLDLIQAESVNDLINSDSLYMQRNALYGLNGSITKVLKEFKERIANALLKIEVDIDYPEYEENNASVFAESIREELSNIVKDMSRYSKKSKQYRPISSGIKIAIVGRPNSGKSSLLNLILQSDRAIVSKTAGTTRDTIEAPLEFEGIKVTFIDTAGLRETKSKIERLGIGKAIAALKDADLVINLIDITKKISATTHLEIIDSNKILNVFNKADLVKNSKSVSGIKISVKNGDINQLIDAVKSKISKVKPKNDESWLNNRQQSLLDKTIHELEKIQKLIQDGDKIDLIATFLKSAVDILDETMGSSLSFSISDEIFSNFCVGK